jgi:diaminopimelate decarboxylase
MEAVESIDGRSRVDVVGPVCESGDFLALDREMEDLRAGDLIAVHSAGAYGYVMASNYNTRGKPAEVVVDGDRFAMVTARESYEHLVAPELLEPAWRVD